MTQRNKRHQVQWARALAQLISAGVPLRLALDQILKTSMPRSLRRFTARCATDVGTGKSLTSCAQRTEAPLHHTLKSAIAIGEECGTLPKMLTRCADLLETISEFHHEAQILKFRFFGQLFMTTLLPAAFMVYMFHFVIPLNMHHAPGLKSIGINSTNPRHLMYLASMLLGAFALIPWTIKFLTYLAKQNWVALRIFYMIPYLGSFQKLQTQYLLATGLSTGYSTGLPVTRSIPVSLQFTGIRGLVTKSQTMMAKVQATSLADALATLGLYSRQDLDQLRIGETSGAVVEALATIGERYRRETRDQLTKIKRHVAFFLKYTTKLISLILLMRMMYLLVIQHAHSI